MKLAKYITLLKSQKFNANQITSIYNRSHLGVITIQDFIEEESRKELINYVKSLPLEKAPGKEGVVSQQFSALYFGKAEGRNLPIDSPLKQLCEEYENLYKTLQVPASFESNPAVNSIGVHCYQVQSEGISPHRDYAKDINLIAILTLTGKTNFLVCNGRTKLGAKLTELVTGDLTVMRAPRSLKENLLRPFHCIDQISEERYSVIMRQRK